VIGPSRLHGATIVSPDIRAGMALIAAALAAHGRSVIRNVQQWTAGTSASTRACNASALGSCAMPESQSFTHEH